MSRVEEGRCKGKETWDQLLRSVTPGNFGFLVGLVILYSFHVANYLLSSDKKYITKTE